MAVRSKYQPFSFQEKLAPLMMLQEQYDKMNENIAALGDQANQYYQYLDPETKAVIDEYNGQLEGLAGSLASDGMKSINRNTLYNLRRMYSSQVMPINNAAQTLAKMYEQQREAEMKLGASGQRMFTTGMPTVKDLLENPSASPYNIGSGALYNQGLQASKSASMRRFSESAFGSEIIRGYINQVKEQGYSPEVVAQFMNDVNTIPELKEAYDSIKGMYGTDTLNDPEGANQFIMRGILDGMLYSRESSQKEDIIGKENRAYARQVSLARLNADLEVETAAKKAAITGKGKSDSSYGRKRTIVSPRAVSTTSQHFYNSKTNTVEVPDYLFDKDGRLKKSTDLKGPQAALFGNNKLGAGREYDKLMDVLREYYSDEEISKMTKDEIEKTLDGMVHNSLQDAEGNSGFYWNLDISNTKELLSRVGELYEVESKEDGKWRYSRNTKDVKSELKDHGSQLIYDPVSDELFIASDNGQKMYRLDKSVIADEDLLAGLDYYHNPNSEFGGMNLMDAARDEMDRHISVLNKYNKRLESGERLTPEEQKEYMAAYEAYTNAASVQYEADELYSSIGPTIMSYLKKSNE